VDERIRMQEIEEGKRRDGKRGRDRRGEKALSILSLFSDFCSHTISFQKSSPQPPLKQ
jgi:hypothetical protein